MLWKRFLRYIAQREVAAERERLDRYAELIGVRFGSVPVAGTHASFLAALGEAPSADGTGDGAERRRCGTGATRCRWVLERTPGGQRGRGRRRELLRATLPVVRATARHHALPLVLEAMPANGIPRPAALRRGGPRRHAQTARLRGPALPRDVAEVLPRRADLCGRGRPRRADRAARAVRRMGSVNLGQGAAARSAALPAGGAGGVLGQAARR
jgi:hypothetical protein